MGVGHAIWAVCAYEKVALETGRVPTITDFVWSCRSKSFLVFCTSVIGVVGALGWAGYHLLLEGWETE